MRHALTGEMVLCLFIKCCEISFSLTNQELHVTQYTNVQGQWPHLRLYKKGVPGSYGPMMCVELSSTWHVGHCATIIVMSHVEEAAIVIVDR